jgi:inorganic pyrophosphatase
MGTCIRVFIENESGSVTKNLHDERLLVHRGSVQVSRPYPFPYGFLLDTVNDDGDNLDCFVLTSRNLKTGSIVECEVVGLMEQTEQGQQDNNILARLPLEQIAVTISVQRQLADFVAHVFDHIPGRAVKAGRFLDAAAAWALIVACRVRLSASEHRSAE